MTKRLSRHACFVALLAAIGVLRVLVLWHNQNFVDGDEAVIGLMAQRWARGEAVPMHFYGQHYNAGAGLEARLAALVFRFCRPGPIALKAAALGLSLLSLCVLYAAIAQLFGGKHALLAAALYGLNPALIYFSLKMRGGYAEAPMLMTAVLFVAAHALAGDGRRPLELLAAALCGLSYCVFEATAPLALAVFLYAVSVSKSRAATAAVWALGMAAGASPALWANAHSGLANIGEVAGFTSRQGSILPLQALQRVAEFPRVIMCFFDPHLDDSHWFITLPSAVWGAAALFGCAMLCLSKWRPFRAPARMRQSHAPAWHFTNMIAVYLPIYFVAYCIFEPAKFGYRHLLPLCPVLSIVIALALMRIARVRRAWAAALAIALAATALAVHARAVRGDWAVVGDRPGQTPETNLRLRYGGIVQCLRERGVTCVMGPWYVVGQVGFATAEKVAIIDLLGKIPASRSARAWRTRPIRPGFKLAIVFEAADPLRFQPEADRPSEARLRAEAVGMLRWLDAGRGGCTRILVAGKLVHDSFSPATQRRLMQWAVDIGAL